MVVVASLPAYDRTVASEEGVQAVPAELLAELERLRAASAEEVARLHAALRESTARARDREREIERLTAEVAMRTDGARCADVGVSGGSLSRPRFRPRRAWRCSPSSSTIVGCSRIGLGRSPRPRRGNVLLTLPSRPSVSGSPSLRTSKRNHQTQAWTKASPRLSPNAREELERRAAELALLRRQLAEVQRRVDERAWRTGALGGRSSPRGVVARAEATFTEGLQALARGGGAPPRERRAGSW